MAACLRKIILFLSRMYNLKPLRYFCFVIFAKNPFVGVFVSLTENNKQNISDFEVSKFVFLCLQTLFVFVFFFKFCKKCFFIK